MGLTSNNLPDILTAQDIADYLKISRRRVYEIMELKDFPLIRIGLTKRVPRDGFLTWHKKQGNQTVLVRALIIPALISMGGSKESNGG